MARISEKVTRPRRLMTAAMPSTSRSADGVSPWTTKLDFAVKVGGI